MYVPAHFAETRVEVLHQAIREHPFASLVTMGANGLESNHIPFEIETEPGPLGTLRGHVARGNPVWREFSRDVEPLVAFQGPQLYISPSLYPTKKETGKVVPTWNYVIVHAYGTMRVIEDKAWLRDLVGKLTDHHEAPRADPWKVSDAPDDYVDSMLGAIVGIEITVTRLVGKWKVSQNRVPADREGVIKGLREQPDAASQAMARLVK